VVFLNISFKNIGGCFLHWEKVREFWIEEAEEALNVSGLKGDGSL
jgi:hypothetical protein